MWKSREGKDVWIRGSDIREEDYSEEDGQRNEAGYEMQMEWYHDGLNHPRLLPHFSTERGRKRFGKKPQDEDSYSQVTRAERSVRLAAVHGTHHMIKKKKKVAGDRSTLASMSNGQAMAIIIRRIKRRSSFMEELEQGESTSEEETASTGESMDWVPRVVEKKTVTVGLTDRQRCVTWD